MAASSNNIVESIANALLNATDQQKFNSEDAALRKFAKTAPPRLRHDLIAFSDAVRRFYGFQRLELVA